VATDRLRTYRSMRDFSSTNEPSGDAEAVEPERPRFTLQQHDATRLHLDLRLEHDGVLLSFALPRGVPWSPDENHLAVHTEDHPLEYLDFHGEIPKGNYGAGSMTIWDTGTYEPVEIGERKVQVVLHGEKAQGRYALFQTRGRDWMIHRMDPPLDPERRPVPPDLRPMVGVPGQRVPGGKSWAFEVRWPGVRVLAEVSGGVLVLRDADGRDVTSTFPELRRLGRAVGYTEVVLDGVVVPVDPDGRPKADAAAIERRLGATSDSAVKRLTGPVPVALILFDVLWWEGHPVTGDPYADRRDRLQSLDLRAGAWQTPAHHVGDGAVLLEAARAQGMPGLVAKRLRSPYRPGQSSDDWLLLA
jgi:bifunctional non-homologous end joining protein LigD